jgi:hypothetical protein
LRLLRPEWGVAYVGEAFEGALRPAGGLRPYRFELADGELPPGLDLVFGRLVGTPTEVGRFSFTTQVQDGNLSQAILRVDLEVRPLPTPFVRVDAPATEVRGTLPLVVRVEDARGWRGARLRLDWDPALFELVAAPTAADARLVVVHDAAAGRLAIDVAALGAPRQGAFALARFSLRVVDGAARLTLGVAATTRYAGGDHDDVRVEGAPSAPPPRAAPAGAETPTPAEAGEGGPGDGGGPPDDDAGEDGSDDDPGEDGPDDDGSDQDGSDADEEEAP